MATRLLLISDTHIPGRAKALPAAVLAAADAADLVIHAGDWVAASVLDELETHRDRPAPAAPAHLRHRGRRRGRAARGGAARAVTAGAGA